MSRLYLLAPQQSTSLSLTLRATAAFSSRLSLQAFAQLFTAGIGYGAPLRAVAPPGRDLIRLDQLAPARPEDAPPNRDSREATLALNLILRWEWRLGSTLSVVYARQLGNQLTPDNGDVSLGSQLGALAAPGALATDSLVIKLDMLFAR